jgi:hypothetical protein
MRVEQCRSCKAPIIWAIARTGRPMPVDVEPIAGGNIELDEQQATPQALRPLAPLARLVRAEPGVLRYRSHFASCPDSWKWKRR